jgi:hypothetical protein
MSFSSSTRVAILSRCHAKCFGMVVILSAPAPFGLAGKCVRFLFSGFVWLDLGRRLGSF